MQPIFVLTLLCAILLNLFNCFSSFRWILLVFYTGFYHLQRDIDLLLLFQSGCLKLVFLVNCSSTISSVFTGSDENRHP